MKTGAPKFIITSSLTGAKEISELNTLNIFYKFGRIKSENDKMVFLQKTKIRTELCILDLERARWQMVVAYLFKKSAQKLFNKDALNYINFAITSLKEFFDEIEIVKTDFETFRHADHYKFPDDNYYHYSFKNNFYYVPDTENNKNFILLLDVEISSFLNELKNLMLPKLKLEIESLGLLASAKSTNSLQSKKSQVVEISTEKLIWKGSKQDLVSLFDKLYNLDFLVKPKTKDQILNKHFVLLTPNNELTSVGELRHTRKLLKDSSAIPSAKMGIIISNLDTNKTGDPR